MSYQTAILMLKKLQHNAALVPSAIKIKSAELASHNRLKNVAVVINSKPNGAEIVFKPMVGAMVNTEDVAKTANALAAKLAAESKDIAKDVL
jgi:hypothetical protein